MRTYTEEEVDKFLTDLDDALRGQVRGPHWDLVVEQVIINFLTDDIEFEDIYDAIEYCYNRFEDGYDKEAEK